MNLMKVFAASIVLTTVMAGGNSRSAIAEETVPMVRLSKLVIDAAQLEAYRAYLTEEVNASMQHEPGVRTLYADSGDLREPSRL